MTSPATYSTALRTGFWNCLACNAIVLEPVDYGEANLQRCPKCDSARLHWNPPTLTEDNHEQTRLP